MLCPSGTFQARSAAASAGAPKTPRDGQRRESSYVLMSDPVDTLLKFALRIVVFLNEQRQAHAELGTSLIEAKEAQLRKVREQLLEQ